MLTTLCTSKICLRWKWNVNYLINIILIKFLVYILTYSNAIVWLTLRTHNTKFSHCSLQNRKKVSPRFNTKLKNRINKTWQQNLFNLKIMFEALHNYHKLCSPVSCIWGITVVRKFRVQWMDKPPPGEKHHRGHGISLPDKHKMDGGNSVT